jgi:hypothetical protein
LADGVAAVAPESADWSFDDDVDEASEDDVVALEEVAEDEVESDVVAAVVAAGWTVVGVPVPVWDAAMHAVRATIAVALAAPARRRARRAGCGRVRRVGREGAEG